MCYFSSPLRLLVALVILLPLAACDTVVSPQVETSPLLVDARPDVVGSQDAVLKAVRQATARFNSTTQALRAGYQPDDHCVAIPGLGGMGYHWVNEGLVDPVFDPLQPEALLYATGPGGNLRLVGVEYVVIDVGQPHPRFAGQLMDVGGVPPLTAANIPHWSLHVWLYEENPRGLYFPFNPNVSCP